MGGMDGRDTACRNSSGEVHVKLRSATLDGNDTIVEHLDNRLSCELL
jgi:hypothetical protein